MRTIASKCPSTFGRIFANSRMLSFCSPPDFRSWVPLLHCCSKARKYVDECIITRTSTFRAGCEERSFCLCSLHKVLVIRLGQAKLTGYVYTFQYGDAI